MDDKKRCLGFSESTLKRCKRLVSKTRLDEGCVTCDLHSEQEDIAKRYPGDVDDDLHIAEHFLREKGLIPEKVVSRQSIEQAHVPVLPQKVTGDVSAWSVEELRKLTPQQFEMRTNWKKFGGGLQVKDFVEGQAPIEAKGSHRAAVLRALTKNAKEFGFLLAPAAALVSAICLVLYYFFLGFGFQSVVVDPTSVTATALLATFLTLLVFFLGNSTTKKKDKTRSDLHQKRYNRVIQFLKQREDMSVKSERVSNSIDVCIRGKAKQENARVTARYLSLLLRKKKAERRPWNKLVQFVSKSYSRLFNSSPQVVEPKGLDLSKVTARELVTLEDAPIDDRIKELQARNAIYSEAEKDVESQKQAALTEGKIEQLNRKIAEDDTELKRLETSSLWVLLTFSKRPYLVTLKCMALALITFVIVTHAAVNYASSYCNQWFRPINCFYLEIAQPDGTSEVTTFHKLAFVHGRVSDHFLVSSLGAEGEPATREGVARINIPVSSVVGMQRYGREYTRKGQSDPIVPVINLTQENAFSITHNTALASGGGNGTDTTVVNYRAEFPVDNREATHLVLNNEFQTNVLVREDIFPVLVSNFILDGKEMSVPEDGDYRHILVPFFLDLVQSESNERNKIYAVDGDASIDTGLDAFMAGFFSLSDPEFHLENPATKDLMGPTNLLGMVRTALGACKPNGKTSATFEISIAGYSSEKPFKGSNGQDSPKSGSLNHALAEGRRFAVLANVVDYDDSLVGKEKAKIILSSRDGNTDQAQFSKPVLNFLMLLKRDNPTELVAFLESVDPVLFYSKLKGEVFRFSDKKEMHEHLNRWVPSVEYADGPVREAFQRSAVISIREEEMEKCGL